MKTEIAKLLLNKYGKKNAPELQTGDTVRVHQKIREGEKERIQIFEGLVIAMKHGKGLDGTFTVRKMAVGNVGVERVFPLHSPNVVKVERTKTAEVSRAKLYYMRDRKGKAARFKKESANPAVWDESNVVVEDVVTDEAVANENEETVTEVEAMMEGVDLVEEVKEDVVVAEEAEVAEEVKEETEEGDKKIASSK